VRFIDAETAFQDLSVGKDTLPGVEPGDVSRISGFHFQPPPMMMRGLMGAHVGRVEKCADELGDVGRIQRFLVRDERAAHRLHLGFLRETDRR